MKEVIKLIEEVFKAHGEGNVFVPAKISLDMELFSEFKTWGNAMPAYFPSWKICGIKWIGGNFENPERHMLPSILGVVVLNDPETFVPLAILSGGWMTAMRTGAATAVAVRCLAKKDSKTACIVGAGYQGRYQLLALNEVLDLYEVRVNDVDKDFGCALWGSKFRYSYRQQDLQHSYGKELGHKAKIVFEKKTH